MAKKHADEVVRLGAVRAVSYEFGENPEKCEACLRFALQIANHRTHLYQLSEHVLPELVWVVREHKGSVDIVNKAVRLGIFFAREGYDMSALVQAVRTISTDDAELTANRTELTMACLLE